MAHEKAKIQHEAALARMLLERHLSESALRNDAANIQREKEIALEAAQKRVENDISASAVQMKLVENLPQVARELPKASEQKNITIAAENNLGSAVAGLLALADLVRAKSNGA